MTKTEREVLFRAYDLIPETTDMEYNYQVKDLFIERREDIEEARKVLREILLGDYDD